VDRTNFNQLKKIFKNIDIKDKIIVDVGSRDFNGSSRPIFKNEKYIGVDISEGKNVDVVMKSDFEIPLENNYADIIVCTSVLEHCKNPFFLMQEMSRILKPKGKIIVGVPQQWGLHDYPCDYWRINPDGMKELFDVTNIEVNRIYTHKQLTIRHGILKMTYGIGEKK